MVVFVYDWCILGEGLHVLHPMQCSTQSAKDIRVELNIPIKDILRNSLEVMTTVGEWQLIDMIAYKESHDAEPPYGSDELVFHVCSDKIIYSY